MRDFEAWLYEEAPNKKTLALKVGPEKKRKSSSASNMCFGRFPAFCNFENFEDFDPKTCQETLIKIYNFFGGYVPIVERFLVFLPELLPFHFGTTCALLEEEGFLLPDFRYLLALLASATMNCKYYYEIYVEKYIEWGGNVDWLTDLKKAPKKVRDILELVPIMAYRPHFLISMLGVNFIKVKIRLAINLGNLRVKEPARKRHR